MGEKRRMRGGIRRMREGMRGMRGGMRGMGRCEGEGRRGMGVRGLREDEGIWEGIRG